ncbi:MAG: hypothetical protein HWQ41_18055 [Nostoc sp. NOS(2021)]|uniref:hypothetical protein n=1 Tax=Nostoc sp. NOS(2021) TaxID=2815407 RepID=UPI0025E7AAAF|nr:hypothetical protein [Nostoc sp. NOS(2021)]MBN3897105.1 hypothetical protein [Nostoc sp. NOS(2021)]
MPPKLDRCKLTIAAVAAAGSTPATPAQDFYFLTSYGVYTGDLESDTDIAGVTEILAEVPGTTDYSPFTFSAIKELVRSGIITTRVVIVTDTSGTTIKKYRKTLHVSRDAKDDFDDLITQCTWPIGKGAGQPITNATNVRHIKSRQ